MERNLWIAVALQAANDINTEDYTSMDYDAAVSFFTAPGEWAESRQHIADCIGRHPEELTRMGRAAIAARHLREPPTPTRVRAVGTRLPTVLPKAPELRVMNPTPVVPLVLRGQSPKNKRNNHYDPNHWFRQFMGQAA
jgi:hypothetical protein